MRIGQDERYGHTLQKCSSQGTISQLWPTKMDLPTVRTSERDNMKGREQKGCVKGCEHGGGEEDARRD